MIYSSPILNFDIMFVIICVVAGATAHDMANSSKSTPIYKSHSRYKSSFIELLLESGVTEEIKTSRKLTNEIDDQPFWRHSHRVGAHELLRNRKESYTLCVQLSNIFSGSQMRFCQKHHELLLTILPQVMHLARSECTKISGDFRWNCSNLDKFLDRSNSLSFTKEAALIRSLINASMMYLTVKTCFKNQLPTCGCQIYDDYADYSASGSPQKDFRNRLERESINVERPPGVPINDVALSVLDLKTLETGSPLRLTRSMVRRQGCTINIPFADAFTRIFMDADDTRSLIKAHKIINEDSINSQGDHKSSYNKRFADVDYKDLSIIRWTKSTANLHNNNIGRQAVRDATSKQCRCHGLSGMCQYQTCWDRLDDIETVSVKLREIYMSQSILAKSSNLGTLSNPDLYLVKQSAKPPVPKVQVNLGEELLSRVGSNDLVYLYQSPSYCDAQPSSGYPGTVGRECSAISSGAASIGKLQFKTTQPADILTNNQRQTRGTCEYLCCNRGFNSELTLDLVDCNCRFEFCCTIQCDQCLRQQMRNFCR